MTDPDFPHLNEFKRIEFPKLPFDSVEEVAAQGANLSPGVLLSAYSQGVFPWYDKETNPILWWSPNPRCVLFPDSLHVSKRMERKLKTGYFIVKSDTCFKEVITNCANINRNHEKGTWIHNEIIEAYINLHNLGWGHSFETFITLDNGKEELVGGLYGISLGKCFFGESMFFKETDASKAAFITMVNFAKQKGIELIDCQIKNSHLTSLGAKDISRKEYLGLLKKLLKYPDFRGIWKVN